MTLGDIVLGLLLFIFVIAMLGAFTALFVGAFEISAVVNAIGKAENGTNKISYADLIKYGSVAAAVSSLGTILLTAIVANRSGKKAIGDSYSSLYG